MDNLHKFIPVICAIHNKKEIFENYTFRRMNDMILEQIKNPDFFNNSEQNMIYFYKTI